VASSLTPAALDLVESCVDLNVSFATFSASLNGPANLLNPGIADARPAKAAKPLVFLLTSFSKLSRPSAIFNRASACLP